MFELPCLGATSQHSHATAESAARAYTTNPGCTARAHISRMDATSRSSGAWSTMVEDPTTESTHLATPKALRRSLRCECASTALTTMLMAPMGVTSMGGAKA